MTAGEVVIFALLCGAIFVLSMISAELGRSRARERVLRESADALRAIAAKACRARCRACGAPLVAVRGDG